jgi:hypothetical protein
MDDHAGLTKRQFLEALGTAPSLRLLWTQAGGAMAAAAASAASAAKCTPLDCGPLFTASDADLQRLMRRAPKVPEEVTCNRPHRGIPFLLGSAGARGRLSHVAVRGRLPV